LGHFFVSKNPNEPTKSSQTVEKFTQSGHPSQNLFLLVEIFQSFFVFQVFDSISKFISITFLPKRANPTKLLTEHNLQFFTINKNVQGQTL
jgi:hypothetical protein